MSDTTTAIEARVMRATFRRLVPFLMLCYFVAYVDRVNVGFAALTMNRDLAFTSTVFRTGAGIFFLGYFLFEVPSNLAVARFGATRWIMRIMLSWGVVAAAMALVSGVSSFYLLRFVLGAAEAGFFPGILFYLTLWFPSAYRGRIIGWFMAAIPISHDHRRASLRADPGVSTVCWACMDGSGSIFSRASRRSSSPSWCRAC
ncbi:MAG: MFS transporter [Acetobacteraceae bacterium]